MANVQTQLGADAVSNRPYWLDPKFYMTNIIAIGIAVAVGYYIGKKRRNK